MGQVWSAQGALTCLSRPAADDCRPCALLSLLVFNQRNPIAWQQSLGGCQLKRAVPNQALLLCSRRHRAAAAAGEALHNGADRNRSQKPYILGDVALQAAASSRGGCPRRASRWRWWQRWRACLSPPLRAPCCQGCTSIASAASRRWPSAPSLTSSTTGGAISVTILIATVAAPAPRRLRRGGAPRLRRLRLALQVPRIQLSACRFGGRRCCGHGPA